MFEQALMVFAKKGGVAREADDETRHQFDQAFQRILALTDSVRDELVSRRVRESFQGPPGLASLCSTNQSKGTTPCQAMTTRARS